MKKTKNLQTEIFEAQPFWCNHEPKIKDLEIQITKMKNDREILTSELQGRDEHIRKEFRENFEAIRRMMETQLASTQEANLSVIRNAIDINQEANLTKLKEGFDALTVSFNQRTNQLADQLQTQEMKINGLE